MAALQSSESQGSGGGKKEAEASDPHEDLDAEGFPQEPGGRGFGPWIQAALEFSRIHKAELGRRLTERLGRSIDRSAVTKMTKGDRSLMADELLAIAELTGYAPPGLPSPPPRSGDARARAGLDYEMLAELLAASFELAQRHPLDGRMRKNLALALLEAARTPEDRAGPQEAQDVSTRLAAALVRVVALQQP
jgi:hypothetical protein